jgi:ATP-dependent DNA helicase PIF1
LIAERDWSAQEVSHILLQLPLARSSRVVVTLDYRPEKDTQRIVTFEDDLVKAQALAYDRYKMRLTPKALRAMKKDPVDLTDLTLLDWLQHFDFYTWKRRRTAKPRVINYFPRYKADLSLDTYEDYCRVKLMLHHAFIVSVGGDAVQGAAATLRGQQHCEGSNIEGTVTISRLNVES